MLRARHALDRLEAVERRGIRAERDRFVLEQQLGEHDNAAGTVFVNGPVETGAADVMVLLPAITHHDVVAAFGIHDVDNVVADVDIVADHLIAGVRVAVVARSAVGVSALEPVVAFVAHHLRIPTGAQDEVLAGSAEHR